MPVRLLTSACNTAVENLSWLTKIICSPLTEFMQCRIKNTSHLPDITDILNEQPMSVSLDIVNMSPSMDNQRETKAIQDILNTRAIKKPSTDYSKPPVPHLYRHADSCHKKLSIKGIQKIALRLRRIYSSNNDYIAKSKEYTKDLVNRGHDFKIGTPMF